MTQEPGEWYQVLVFAVLLACVAAWIIARRYRRRMQELMRAPQPVDSRNATAVAAETTTDHPAPALVSLAQHRAASTRLATLLILSSSLLAATSAVVFCHLRFPADPLRLSRLVPITLLHL